MTLRETLEWSLSHLEEAEAACDHAANLAAVAGETPIAAPELDKAEREIESWLISRLECRPGGLDPNTPSRDRVWLWRGLSGVLAE